MSVGAAGRDSTLLRAPACCVLVHVFFCATWVFGQTEPESAQAASDAGVAMAAPAEPVIWVGQRFPFSIDLLAVGAFSGTPAFDLPDIPAAILMKSAERPSLSTRRLKGQTYVVQSHSFSLFVQRAGRITVPSINVRFASAPQFGAEPAEHELATEAFTLEIKAPPGWRPGEQIVCASELEVSENWSPVPSAARVGAAFTREVTLRAKDVPAMLLPSLPRHDVDGLGVYPKEPSLGDEQQRGKFTGQRTEQLTYVCERPGRFVIPAVAFRWWDPSDESWKERRLDEVVLDVRPSTAGLAGMSSPESTISDMTGGYWWKVLTCMVVLAAGAYCLALWWLRRSRETQQPGHLSERTLFARAKAACRTGDPREAYQAITLWLPQWGLQTSSVGDNCGVAAAEFTGALKSLQHAIVVGRAPWDGRDLARRIAAMRRQLMRRRQHSRKLLPALNECHPAGFDSTSR
ncbi:MAG: BatD family protein [Gemmatimonadota bacterium]|nr:MAG: BatD family protein [Gemmatimonadota bacterium]